MKQMFSVCQSVQGRWSDPVMGVNWTLSRAFAAAPGSALSLPSQAGKVTEPGSGRGQPRACPQHCSHPDLGGCSPRTALTHNGVLSAGLAVFG